MSEFNKKALSAINKPAQFGPDLDLSEYSRNVKSWNSSLSELPDDIKKRASDVGVCLEDVGRAGTFFQIDHSVIHQGIGKAFSGKAEIMNTKEAFEKWDWFKDYWWKLIDVDTDKYTALAGLEWDYGYLIRVREGEKITLPLQACLFMANENVDQNVHNVVILEPYSEAQIITGCVVHPNVGKGLHIGISEFYIKKGAKLTFTMIHNWKQNIDVRPRTAILLEDSATLINNYVCLKPLKSIQTFPVAYCKGNKSTAVFNSIVYGTGESIIDLGSKLVLEGNESRGQVNSRAIATDKSQIFARGMLIGDNKTSRGHLECNGLMLSDTASIYAIPELIANKSGTELSHEAAIGKVADEQIRYLMSRGFSEAEATSLIIRGFMDVRIFGLPEFLEKEIQSAIDLTTQRIM